MPARDETWQVVMPADDLWEGRMTGAADPPGYGQL